MMTGREAVLRALEFRGPDRIPLAKGVGADMGIVGYGAAQGFLAERGGDEWGCRKESLHGELGDQGQVLGHPLKDWGNFLGYRFPSAYAPGRMEPVRMQVEDLKRKKLFVWGSVGRGPMHLLQDLRSFEGTMEDLAEYPERVEALAEGIFAFLEGLTRQYAEVGVDGIYLIDDQAMQSGPVFSMESWWKHLGGRYQRLFGLAHERGMKVYMHACGNLQWHLPALQAVGVDLLDNKQPSLWMSSPGLERVRGKMAFSSCLDIQTTIHQVAEEAVEGETHRLIARLGTPAGGFVGTYYHQADLALPREKVARMQAAFGTFQWITRGDRGRLGGELPT